MEATKKLNHQEFDDTEHEHIRKQREHQNLSRSSKVRVICFGAFQ